MDLAPTTPIINDAAIKRTSFPNEIPTAPKKLILSTEKNVMILAKSDNQITEVLPSTGPTENLPVLQIIEVDPVMIDERDEQLLILPSSSLNINESTSRDIIEIDSVIQREHDVTSKSSGT